MNHKLIAVVWLSWLGLFPFQLTVVAQPVVTALAATGISQTNATLNGTVNPNGAPAAAYFQFGLTTNYDNLGGFVALPATNTAQTLPGLVVAPVRSAADTNWQQTSAPATNWYAIASSADGTRLAAVIFDGGIYTSANAGVTWTPTSAPSTNWNSIASSADGLRLAAVVSGGGIHTSTNAGATWTQTGAPGANWSSLAASADGSRLAATVYNGGIYTSTNSGSTWTQTSASTNFWNAIAASADGTRLAAAASGSGIYVSTNSGGTWTPTSAPGGIAWISIAASADGTRLAAAAFAERIYTSTNSGSTWTQAGAPHTSWNAIASSIDGTRLAAVSSGGIYTSTNAGSTWTPPSMPGVTWSAIAASGDGSRLAATASGGGIYTATGATNYLIPGTTYHFRVVGLNSLGTSLGSDLTFTTSAGAPTATTLAASGIAATNVTLNGALTTGGLNTTAYFRYGLTTSYGSFSATNIIAGTNSVVPVSSPISGLSLITTYHFQLVVSNSAGTALGGDIAFTTQPLPPLVTTLPATGITQTNATLNGSVNPNQAATTAYFQYGLTTNYDQLGGLLVLPATNTTKILPGLTVGPVPGPAGANWIQTAAPTNYWYSISSSADGLRLAAWASGDGVYVSTNGGGTWTKSSVPNASVPNIPSTGVASSADGLRLVTVVGLSLYTSTNGGTTWAPSFSISSDSWSSLASSADGLRLVAATLQTNIYTSTDGGGTWTPSGAPATHWECLASSADGSRLAAGTFNTGIYISTNGGISWTQSSAPQSTWNFIASSADGLRLVAANSSFIYRSVDGGATWTQTSAPISGWRSLASSADGLRLAAAAFSAGSPVSGIYTSTNGGSTWTHVYGGSFDLWEGIACSADGAKLATAGYNNGIFTSAGTPNNLLPGTTYHYRLTGINSAGVSLGNDLTFTTSPGAPTAATLAATSITATNALLNGTVNPYAGNTSVYFQYGLTTSYGGYSATNNLSAPNSLISVSNLVSSLSPLTTYHFRLVATNGQGIAVGDDLTFTTIPLPPVTTTLPATYISDTSATLNGSVNPNQVAATVYFQYGLTTDYGTQSPLVAVPATNGTVNVPGVPVSALGNGPGASWPQTSLPVAFWSCAASSADGLRLAAAAQNNGIYTSTNGGSTWTLTSAPTNNWYAIASSADGSRLAAVVFNEYIYTSTNGGVSWTTNTVPPLLWSVIASSADGTRLAAGAQNGGIYTSTNSGGTWALTTAPTQNWYSIASSADGTRLAATTISQANFILTSTNGGAAWTSNSVPTAFWNWIACSADGARLAVVMYGGGIRTSTNGGATWTITSAPTKNWVSIASSADGTRLAASVDNGGIYISTDSGVNWAPTPAPSAQWRGIATSADGTHLVAAAKNGRVYTYLGPPVDLTPGATYHYRVVSYNSSGTNYGNDLTFTTALAHAENFGLNKAVKLPGGAFQFGFTNLSGLSFTVLGATNLTLPLSNWTVLGAPVETPPGQYQFTDPLATNSATRFYRVRSP